MGKYRQQFFVGVLLLAFLTLQLIVYSHQQPQIAGGFGRGDDGVYYGVVADAFFADERPVTLAPFVHRIGVPWLAAVISRLGHIPIDDSFRAINIVTNYLLTVLVYVLALRFCPPLFAGLACVLYMLPFYGFVRLTFFYPVLVDTPWMVLIVLSLLIMARKSMSSFSMVCLAGITFAATMIRETGLLIPMSFLLSTLPVGRLLSTRINKGDVPSLSNVDSRKGRHPEESKDLGEVGDGVLRLRAWGDRVRAGWIPACAGMTGLREPNDGVKRFFFGLLLLFVSMLAIYLSRSLTTAVGEYTFVDAALESLRNNTPWHFALSAFLAFGGPMMALVIIRPQPVLTHLRATPVHSCFILMTVVISYIGGVDTVRFMSWASPLVLILICLSLQTVLAEISNLTERVSKAILSSTLAGMIIFQLIVLHPFDGYFADYTAWLFWGGLQISIVNPLSLFYFIVVTMLAIVVWRLFDTARTREPQLAGS